MEIEEYKDLLEKHDWYYMFSDDNKVYDNGKNSEENLIKLYKENPELEILYKARIEKYFYS